jgi:hypothetical protein
MLKHLSLAVIASLAALGACSSSDEDGDGDLAAAGTAGSAGGVSVNITGGTGGADGGTPVQGRDGGIQILTDDEVETINTASCAGWRSEPESLPSVLQLVVDTSLSMNESPDGGGFGGPGGPGGGGDSKWDITREALREAIAGLPDSIPVGLFFYPNMANEASQDPADYSACVNTDEGIPIDYLTDPQRENIEDALDNTEPDGWTPTHGAYRHALDTFLMPTELPGQKFMVLITDGAPTLTLECTSADDGGFGQGGPTPVDADPIVDEVSAARQVGVRTFLIGSPGSEPGRQWMSTAAIYGATAASGCEVMGEPWCHMDMTQATDFSAALRAGLAEITGAIVSCAYDLPVPPAGKTLDPNLINLIITTSGGETQLVRPDESGDCTEGWQFIDEQVVLCSETCDRVQNDPAGQLQLLFGCGTDIIPVQ